MVYFLGTILGLKGEVIDSFHQPFREFLWCVFFLFLFVHVSLGDGFSPQVFRYLYKFSRRRNLRT